MAIGKTAPNGTLNADGAFYSVQDVNVLLENAGGGDLPTPTVADAGKAVVVDADGKYALDEAGGGGLLVTITRTDAVTTLDKNYREIKGALTSGKSIVFMETDTGTPTIYYKSGLVLLSENSHIYNVILYDIEASDNSIVTRTFTCETDTGTLTHEEG